MTRAESQRSGPASEPIAMVDRTDYADGGGSKADRAQREAACHQTEGINAYRKEATMIRLQYLGMNVHEETIDI